MNHDSRHATVDCGVTTEVSPNGAVTIRIDRPEVRNALGAEQLTELLRILIDCDRDPSIGVVVITGSADSFCSGINLKEVIAATDEERSRLNVLSTELMMRITSMSAIVITAVNGASAGLGNHLAICSDITLCREDAVFHFTGPAKGIASMQLGGLVLPLVVGLKQAKWLLLRGGVLSAAQAGEMGLCQQIIGQGDWEHTVSSTAELFASRDPRTMTHDKYQLNQVVYQLYGPLMLSGMAGSGRRMDATTVTGRLSTEGAL